MSRFLGSASERDPEPELDLFGSPEEILQPVVEDEPRPKTTRRSPRGCARGCGRLVVTTIQLGLLVGILAIISFAGAYIYLSGQLEQTIDRVVQYQGQGPGGTPRFYDRHGTLLFELRNVVGWITTRSLVPLSTRRLLLRMIRFGPITVSIQKP